MGECSECGTTGALTRYCNHCGKEVCSEHTLSEKHDCPAIKQFGRGSKHLQNDLEARRDPDTDATNPDKYRCDECGDAYEYYADAQHCCQGTPDPTDAPRTHGGSGRDTDAADFPSSPDVNADGSINDEELNAELDQIRESATAEQGLTSTVSQKLDLLWLKLKIATPSLRTLLAVFVIAVVTVGQLGLAPVPGFPVDTSSAESLLDDAETGATNATDETTQASTAGTNTDSAALSDTDPNRTRIEYLIHKRINDRRQDHGLAALTFDTDLREIARYHSRDMADQQYFAHTAPDDETMEDRYEKYGYSCRVSVGENRYMGGAENIAYTYAHEEITREDGEVVYHSNETDLARGLVNQWMKSTGHRKNILRDYWNKEAIGVAIVEVDGKTRIYATQNFC